MVKFLTESKAKRNIIQIKKEKTVNHNNDAKTQPLQPNLKKNDEPISNQSLNKANTLITHTRKNATNSRMTNAQTRADVARKL